MFEIPSISAIARKILCCIGLSILLSLPMTAQTDFQQRTNEQDEVPQHIMNLRNVDVNVLIDDVSRITGYTFIVHPSVRASVTVTSQSPLTTTEVFEVFLSVLRINGYAASPAGAGSYKIIPATSVRSDAILTDNTEKGARFETYVAEIKNMPVSEIERLIQPLVDPQGLLLASVVSNKIILVDYGSNIQRIREVLAEVDVDRSVVRTIHLNNISASEMVRTVNALLAEGSPSFILDVGAIAVEDGNLVVLRGNSKDVDRIAEVVTELDSYSQTFEESLRVFRIEHGKAEDLVPIVTGLATSMAEGSSDSGQTRVPTISVHTPTNSLIISASPQILRELERVVSELDVRRSQVLVEAIIVELSDSARRELGMQFIAGGPNDTPIAITNFARTNPSILGLAGALISEDVNDSDNTSAIAQAALQQLAGVNGGRFGFASQTKDRDIFAAVINAVQDDTDSRILSTPSVMTLDNEQAVFLSGQEIPVTRGEALVNNNSNPFRLVERKDVGIRLEVTPQISDGDTVHLAIKQEVSSIFGAITPTTPELITNKREITTTVLADNGDVVILGGLIQEDENISRIKVPFFGDIPLLGRLFSSEGKSTSRTNLMIFLRPTILRDRESVRDLTNQRIQIFRDAEREYSRDKKSSLDDFIGDTEQ